MDENLTDDVLRSAREWLLAAGKDRTMRAFVDRIYRQKYPQGTLIADGAGRARSESPRDCPTARQIAYAVKSRVDPVEWQRKRLGAEVYALTKRPRTEGDPGVGPLAPGMIYVVDATTLDFYVRSASGRPEDAERLTMYFVVDYYSHMIVGYTLCHDASIQALCDALFNAFTCDADLRAAYGVPVPAGDPMTAGLPRRLLTDRGEAHKAAFGRIAASLALSVETAPVHRGDRKGIVETQFRWWHDFCVDLGVPGLVTGGTSARRDPRAEAVLTPSEAAELIQLYIDKHNHQRVQTMSPSDQMLEEGVPAVPVELWRHGVDRAGFALRSVPRDFLCRQLLEHCTAVPTAEGIRWKGNVYVPRKGLPGGDASEEETAAVLHLSAFAAVADRHVVDIYVDPADVSRIYVRRASGTPLVTCVLRQSGLLLAPTHLLQLEYRQARVAALNSAADASSRMYSDKVMTKAKALMEQSLRLEDVAAPAPSAVIPEHPIIREEGHTATGEASRALSRIIHEATEEEHDPRHSAKRNKRRH